MLRSSQSDPKGCDLLALVSGSSELVVAAFVLAVELVAATP